MTKKTRKTAGSLSNRAYVSIRDGILRGLFPMGTSLSRRKLAAQLGMSPLPISEALRQLESEGLVESRPRVGTRVRVPTPQDLRDRYIIREALECQSARLFAEKASAAERSELRTMAARLDGMMEHCSNGDVDPSDIFRTQAYHMAFHMRMAECTGSPTLRDAIEKNRVLVFNWLYDVAAHVHLPPRWHQNLMDVVAEHDPEAAEAAMRQHIRRGLEEIQAAITSQFVERFEPTRPLKDFPPTRLKRT